MECRTTRDQLLKAQQNEIDECHIYRSLAADTRDGSNRQVLEDIGREEFEHYQLLKGITRQDLQPRKMRVLLYRFVARVLGLSFGLRLMEKGEKVSQHIYCGLREEVPEAADMFADEQRHESEILGLIREERIEYAGAIVLGLNDALVELTGALAGLTFALQNSRLIAMTGFVTGIAASMSMTASAYLSAREGAGDPENAHPRKSAAYTGCAYIVAVLILVSPYLFIGSVYRAAALMIALSVLIILAYNLYITTAKGLRLWPRFLEMAGISIGVAIVSFLIGAGIRVFFGVDV